MRKNKFTGQLQNGLRSSKLYFFRLINHISELALKILKHLKTYLYYAVVNEQCRLNLLSAWDTDSNKSADCLLNPILYIIYVSKYIL